jgi:hypothetical protein
VAIGVGDVQGGWVESGADPCKFLIGLDSGNIESPCMIEINNCLTFSKQYGSAPIGDRAHSSKLDPFGDGIEITVAIDEEDVGETPYIFILLYQWPWNGDCCNVWNPTVLLLFCCLALQCCRVGTVDE